MKRRTLRVAVPVVAASVVVGATLLGNAATAAASESTLKAYTTAYSYWDNTPPGSADISNPVLHNKAGGVGTFADPVTLAVGHSIISKKDVLDFPQGTKFYFPDIRKYAIVEDTCGDGKTPQNGPCHRLDTPGNKAPAGAQVWLDIWADGKAATRAQSDKCLSKVTDGNGAVHTAIKDPVNDYLVEPKPISEGATCRANYGNTPVKATPSPTPTPTPTQPTPTPTPTPTGPPTCVPAKP